MIEKQYIVDSLKDTLKKDYFLVDVKIGANSKVTVHVDNFEGIKLAECREIHKKLYALIEQKTEEFELEVSSPGLTSNLKVWQQYKKIIGKDINITTRDGQNFDAILKNADEEKTELEKPNKELITLLYTEIKKAKQVIKF
ncbi:MAG: hypothetical protein JXL97_01475 [Bacteroidales bacterium]|nr:hypothetical protein [Bacteroidales bacterium]